MNTNLPIGFLQEDFHSEVLSFLFELVVFKFPNRKMILYNTNDRYDNKVLYKKTYQHLEIRDLKHFLPDLHNKVCEKYFVISYDNIFNFTTLLHYTNDLIYIAHSAKHIETFNKYKVNYFSLTSLLSTIFTLPITKNIYNFKCDIHNDNLKITDMMETIKQKDLPILISIGSFLENNKDLLLIEKILDTEKYIIIVYTNEISRELQSFVNKYRNHLFVALNLTTTEIQHHIKFFNINYSLFLPPNSSNYYTSTWSGSIQFAFDNNLSLVIPKTIADMYHITNPSLITYESHNDMLTKLYNNQNNNNHNSINRDYQIVRNQIFSRNTVVFDLILGETKTSKLGDYHINYHTDTSHIQTKLDVYDKIIKIVGKHTNFEKKIVIINPEDTIFTLTMLLLNKKCNVILFIPDLDTAKYYKSIFIINDFQHRIKIYNLSINSHNSYDKNINIQHSCLDNLDQSVLDNVSIIYNNKNNILSGAKSYIQKHKPIIISNFENEKTIKNQDYTQITGDYTQIICKDYTIYVQDSKNNYS